MSLAASVLVTLYPMVNSLWAETVPPTRGLQRVPGQALPSVLSLSTTRICLPQPVHLLESTPHPSPLLLHHPTRGQILSVLIRHSHRSWQRDWWPFKRNHHVVCTPEPFTHHLPTSSASVISHWVTSHTTLWQQKCPNISSQRPSKAVRRAVPVISMKYFHKSGKIPSAVGASLSCY